MSAYEMRISDWSSDVCSSDLRVAGKQPHEAVLDAVGVLELVHQQLAEALPVVRQQRRRVAQHLVRAQQDLGEVDQPGTVAALLVQRVALEHHVRPFIAIGLDVLRSEEHTSELQSLMRISYAVFCLKKK